MARLDLRHFCELLVLPGVVVDKARAYPAVLSFYLQLAQATRACFCFARVRDIARQKGLQPSPHLALRPVSQGNRIGSLEPGWEPWPVNPDRVRKIAAYLGVAIARGKPLVRPGCLALGLTRYYFFRRAGMDVSLHFGMGRIGKEKEFVGHCWLTRTWLAFFHGGLTRTTYR
jgi:Transglutaminase-like superfamily